MRAKQNEQKKNSRIIAGCCATIAHKTYIDERISATLESSRGVGLLLLCSMDEQTRSAVVGKGRRETDS